MNNKKSILLMYIAFLIYSLTSIFSKIAAKNDFMSLMYVICFITITIILGIYAVIWQQVLKEIPLSIAMSNKPIVLILTTIWSILLFKETVSIKTIIGIFIILLGIFIVGNRKNER